MQVRHRIDQAEAQPVAGRRAAAFASIEAMSQARQIFGVHAALLHGSAVEPGEAIERFQQDTFGVGEAQLIRARNNSEKSPNPK